MSLYLTVPSVWDHYPLLPDCFYSWGLHISILQFHHTGDHYPYRPVCSIILGTTTHPICLFHHPGDHYTSLPDNSIILGTASQQPDCNFILGTITHLFRTVQSSWRPLLTSTWLLHRPGDHCQIIIWRQNQILLNVTKTLRDRYMDTTKFWDRQSFINVTGISLNISRDETFHEINMMLKLNKLPREPYKDISRTR